MLWFLMEKKLNTKNLLRLVAIVKYVYSCKKYMIKKRSNRRKTLQIQYNAQITNKIFITTVILMRVVKNISTCLRFLLFMTIFAAL